jgi:hypothetical protein
MARFADAFPGERFVLFDAASVYQNPWKAVVHLGIARSTEPGARLSDAWAGSVPVLQFVDPIALAAQRRRHGNELFSFVVDHGKSGLMSPAFDDLIAALGDLLADPMPTRAVARAARRRVDPAAEWDSLLQEILQ